MTYTTREWDRALAVPVISAVYEPGMVALKVQTDVPFTVDETETLVVGQLTVSPEE